LSDKTVDDDKEWSDFLNNEDTNT